MILTLQISHLALEVSEIMSFQPPSEIFKNYALVRNYTLIVKSLVLSQDHLKVVPYVIFVFFEGFIGFLKTFYDNSIFQHDPKLYQKLSQI